jgi:CRP/FNR family transcriptional regulator, anaerobic regulatory protein
MGAHSHERGPAGCIEIVPIFSGLAAREMMEVAAITRERRFGKGETIYLAGKDEKRLYVIHSGLVKVSRIGATGRAQLIRVLGPGEFLGELGILNDAPLPDYAEAAEASVMCVIDGTRLRELMLKYPTIALKVMEELSSRLEKAESLIEDIAQNPAEERLARALLELCGEGGEARLAVTKGDFASQLGMTQETLSRKLSLFQERGLIGQKGQRTIAILDREGLAAIGFPG